MKKRFQLPSTLSVATQLLQWSNTSATSIETLNAASIDFILSPNPATNILNIHCSKLSPGSYQVCITNALGQSIYLKEGFSADQQIDISSFKNGVYFIGIKTSDDFTGRYKILKE